MNLWGVSAAALFSHPKVDVQLLEKLEHTHKTIKDHSPITWKHCFMDLKFYTRTQLWCHHDSIFFSCIICDLTLKGIKALGNMVGQMHPNMSPWWTFARSSATCVPVTKNTPTHYWNIEVNAISPLDILQNGILCGCYMACIIEQGTWLMKFIG